MDEATIEQIKAEFFDEKIIQPFNIYRADRKGGRNYIVVDEEMWIAPSVTTVLKEMPTSKFLLDWFINHGSWEKIKFFSGNAESYGTYMHVIINRLLENEKFIFDEAWIENDMESFFLKNGFYNQSQLPEFFKWMKQEKRDIRKDIYGWITWAKEYKVKPIAIETPLFVKPSDGVTMVNAEGADALYIGKYAGCADLICELTLPEIKSGKNKRPEQTVRALIDWKSRMTGIFYDGEELQLAGYKQGWDLMYPEMKIDKVFNWSPANFRMPPGKSSKLYNFKDQTENLNVDLFNKYVEIYHMKNKYEFKPEIDFKNMEVSLDAELENVFEEVDFLDRIKDMEKEGKEAF